MFNLFLKIFKNKILNNFEEVELFDFYDTDSKKVMAKVDTGADRSSIDEELAKKLGLLREENIHESKLFKSGLGQHERQIVGLKFKLKNKIIDSKVSVIDRSHMKYQFLVGRRDMDGFLVNPEIFKK